MPRARSEIGDVIVGESFTGRSLIDSRFDCRIEGETTVGGHPAILPSLSGRAWITGTHQHMLDPQDPWPDGYRLSDT
jgi:proline racemase